MYRFFILFVLLSISSSLDAYDGVQGTVKKVTTSKRSVGNSTLLLSSKPDSICFKSIYDDGRIAACLEPGVCALCSAFCFNNNYGYFCCHGDYCCCYTTPGNCDRINQCPTNNC